MLRQPWHLSLLITFHQKRRNKMGETPLQDVILSHLMRSVVAAAVEQCARRGGLEATPTLRMPKQPFRGGAFIFPYLGIHAALSPPNTSAPRYIRIPYSDEKRVLGTVSAKQPSELGDVQGWVGRAIDQLPANTTHPQHIWIYRGTLLDLDQWVIELKILGSSEAVSELHCYEPT